jgi:hypothetical protein
MAPMRNVSPEHPRLPFLFALDEDYTEDDVAAIEELVEELASSRQWTLGAPDFIDQRESSDEGTKYEQHIRTVGGVIDLYSGFPPWGDQIRRDVDLAQLDDVKAIVAACSEFTKRRGLTITLELNDTWCGWIEKGVPDEAVTVGLIGEWEKALQTSA